MSRTTISAKSGKLLSGFPDCAATPHVIGNILHKIDPKHPGIEMTGCLRGIKRPILAYKASGKTCLKIASDLETISPRKLSNHIEQCKKIGWYAPIATDEEIAYWIQNHLPRYFRRLKSGWKCVG